MELNELDKLIDKWYYEAEKGDEDAKFRLTLLAKQNISNYDSKSEIFNEYSIKWWGDGVATDYVFSKDDAKKVVELCEEFLKYFPFDNGRLMFMAVVSDNPEFLYEDKGFVTPEFYNYIFDRTIDSRKEDGTSLEFGIAMRENAFKRSCVEIIDTCNSSHNWNIVADHISEKCKEFGWKGE